MSIPDDDGVAKGIVAMAGLRPLDGAISRDVDRGPTLTDAELADALTIRGLVVSTPPQTFTTQRVPKLVHDAIEREVERVLGELKPKDMLPVRSSHLCVMIHPNDWRWMLEYMRQQGTLDESNGPINVGSVEISGITVLQDLGGKVPHLELSA